MEINVAKCDRCGAITGNCEHHFLSVERLCRLVLLGHRRYGFEFARKHDRYDLCDECAAELRRWMGGDAA